MINIEKSTQICSICKKEKCLSKYNKNKSRKSGLSTVCKGCSKKVSKEYYKNNKEKHLVAVKKRKITVRNKSKKLIVSHLKNNPCVDCGEKDIRTLQFDHKNLGNKYNDISKMLASGILWKTIEKEINKCDVRCANCHAKRTSKQFNWYKEEYL